MFNMKCYRSDVPAQLLVPTCQGG